MNEKIDVNIINNRNAGYGAEDPGINEKEQHYILQFKKRMLKLLNFY